MKRVIRHIVSTAVGPAVLKSPHGKSVQLLALPDWQRSAVGTVVTTTSIDPAIRILLLQGTVHGLHLAQHVVSINVLHPVITAILAVVVLLIRAALGSIDLRLETIVLLHLFEVGNGLRE